MTAFFFSALIQKEEGDRVEKTDGFSCDETAGKGIFNDGSGTDIILTGDNKVKPPASASCAAPGKGESSCRKS